MLKEREYLIKDATKHKNTMTFNEFLNVDSTDSQKIFEFYLNFLGELSGKNFPFEEQLKLRGAAGKFLNSIDRTTFIKPELKEDYQNQVDEFQRFLKFYRRRESRSSLYNFIIPTKSLILKLQDSFENLYSSTLGLINESSNKTYYFDDLEINDFYQPNNSNKQKIADLITEAIELISNDESITEKSRRNLIEYLKKTLKELERERINWNMFLGKLNQTIIVLGALGSFVGGASPLFKAQEKLEQTSIVIQNTSINLNYNVLNQTFNSQTIKHICGTNNFLKLSEGTEIVEAEELSHEEK